MTWTRRYTIVWHTPHVADAELHPRRLYFTAANAEREARRLTAQNDDGTIYTVKDLRPATQGHPQP